MGPDPVVLGKTAERPRPDWWRIDPKGPVNLTFRLSEPPSSILRLDERAVLFAGASGAWRIGPWAAADHLVTGPVEPIGAVEPFAGDRARVNAPSRSGISHLLAEAETVRLAPGELLLHPRPANEGQLRAVSGHQLILEQLASSGTLSLIAEDPRGAHPLLRLNAFLASRTWPAVRAIRHKSPSGAVVTSWLLRPANLAADVRLPLLILPYPGLTREAPPAPYGAGQAAFRHAPAVLASCGYAVLLPSLPRSPHSEPAEGLADQILSAADAAIAGGGVDPDRVAIWGHSFGGYAALVTAAKSDRIKAVIAASAPTDLVAFRGAFTPQTALFPEDGIELTAGAGWTEGGQGGLGVAPWTDPERYRRNSPLFLAPQIHAPVLLIHGDRDNVAVSQGQAMFAALWRLDHDAEFLTLWGEGHVASSPATLRAVYQRALAFLAWSLRAPPPETSSASGQSPARPISAD
jgi:dipeptidyl aminopeptidase/acylaminoacyl peptidase